MNTVYESDSVFLNSSLVPGERYLVTFDGQDYECIAMSYTAPLEGEDGMQTVIYIGAMDFASGEAQYPFIMQQTSVYAAGSNVETFRLKIATIAEGESHTVSIRQLDVTAKPLDADALPVLYLAGRPFNLLQAFMLLVEVLSDSMQVPVFTTEAPSNSSSSVEESNSSGGSSSSGDNGR